jgi:hypothetical protein
LGRQCPTTNFYGEHAYSSPGTYTVTVTVKHKLNYTTPATATGSAQVTSALPLGGPQLQAEQAFVQELYRDLLGREVQPNCPPGLGPDFARRSKYSEAIGSMVSTQCAGGVIRQGPIASQRDGFNRCPSRFGGR